MIMSQCRDMILLVCVYYMTSFVVLVFLKCSAFVNDFILVNDFIRVN